MKNLKYISVLLIAFLLTGCEDVINVDLPTGEPKLVVDASLNFQLGAPGNEQVIKLSTTTGYYEPTVPKVTGATVFVTNTDTNQVFDFIENIGTGDYLCTTFIPDVNGNYELTVVTGGQTYTATEKLIPVVPIDKIEQKEAPFGDDSVEINVFFTDNGATDDFYMFRYITSFGAVPNYGVGDDEFFQGNQFNDVYFNDELKPGASFDVTLFGVSEQFHNYMNLLLDVAGGGGPFATAPARIKGNILNATDAQNTAFGYFRLSQTDTRNYVVE